MGQSTQDKRELRRKRRQRNQIIAYIAVIFFIVLLAAGIIFGVSHLSKLHSNEPEEEIQEQLEEILQQEEEIPTPSPTPPEEIIEELTPQQKLDGIVNAGIEVMPIEDKVAGLFIVTPEAITGVSTAVKAGEGTQKALAEYSVGGLVYFKKNIKSEEQLKEMISNTLLYSNYPLFIAVDEEGGSVSRLADANLVTRVDTAAKIGESNDAANAYQAGKTIGEYLNQYGFNLDFAPVADLKLGDDSVIGNRAYGGDANSVAAFVTNAMLGMKENKVAACLKHFPGIGSSTQDTHTGLASTDRTAQEFRENDFVVFQRGIEAGADMIMVSHMSVPAFDESKLPSSLSEAVVTGVLRNELGFEGIVITDALNMAAISEYYAADQAAIMALKAGCDMLLMPEDFEKAYNGVLQAVKDGIISEERIDDALRRIYRVKYADKVTE